MHEGREGWIAIYSQCYRRALHKRRNLRPWWNQMAHSCLGSSTRSPLQYMLPCQNSRIGLRGSSCYMCTDVPLAIKILCWDWYRIGLGCEHTVVHHASWECPNTEMGYFQYFTQILRKLRKWDYKRWWFFAIMMKLGFNLRMHSFCVNFFTPCVLRCYGRMLLMRRGSGSGVIDALMLSSSGVDWLSIWFLWICSSWFIQYAGIFLMMDSLFYWLNSVFQMEKRTTTCCHTLTGDYF